MFMDCYEYVLILPRRRPCRPGRQAFSLLELLLVMAIITLLVGLGLGGLGSVRRAAQATRCLGNLRQLGCGIQVYAANQRGMLPPGAIASGEQTMYKAYHLPGMLIMNDCLETKITPYSSANPCTAAQRTVFDCPAARDVNVSTLASYAFCGNADNAVSDTCQGFTETRYGTFGAWVLTTSYTVNALANGGDPGIPFDEMNASDTPARIRTKPLAALVRPAGLALVWDGAGPILNGAIARITGRHGNRTQTNVLFADGHARAWGTFPVLHPAYSSRALTGEVAFFTR